MAGDHQPPTGADEGVTPRPVRASQDADFTFSYTLPVQGSTDTLAAGLISPAFGDTVRDGIDRPVPSYVVRYEILESPPAPNNEKTVVLTGASGRDSSVFVTDASGHTQAHIRVRVAALLSSGTATGKVVVRAHLQFRGDSLPITPTDTFVISLSPKLP